MSHFQVEKGSLYETDLQILTMSQAAIGFI